MHFIQYTAYYVCCVITKGLGLRFAYIGYVCCVITKGLGLRFGYIGYVCCVITKGLGLRFGYIGYVWLLTWPMSFHVGSRNPLRTSTWCGLVGTNGRCAPLLSAKVGICQLKISIGTRKSTLTATKHQDNSLSDIRLQDSTRTMTTRWRFAEDFSRKPHRSSTRCALVGTDGRCALSLSAKVGICQPEPL